MYIFKKVGFHYFAIIARISLSCSTHNPITPIPNCLSMPSFIIHTWDFLLVLINYLMCREYCLSCVGSSPYVISCGMHYALNSVGLCNHWCAIHFCGCNERILLIHRWDYPRIVVLMKSVTEHAVHMQSWMWLGRGVEEWEKEMGYIEIFWINLV